MDVLIYEPGQKLVETFNFIRQRICTWFNKSINIIQNKCTEIFKIISNECALGAWKLYYLLSWLKHFQRVKDKASLLEIYTVGS